ncbi:MAG: hypothetical protein CSA58_04395 [Micrococcales bacterium]|nr:MAG: hypothetical protein CSB46_05770 [Micrococcales bacterium]PIE27432.1 MAG: hypothetical protein CSA58_04395 [Micrococcales bacterium]
MKFGIAYTLYASITLAAVTYLLVGHLTYVTKGTNYALAFTMMWSHLAIKLVSSLKARPHTVAAGFDMASLRVDVTVPIYNEDPALLAAGVRSIATQRRLPRTVWLVDDGTERDGQPFAILGDPEVVAAVSSVRSAGVDVQCIRQANQGKRHALATAFSRSDADVYITVDSDTVLKKDAIEKIIVPFSRPEVMSVAGTACGQNYQRSLFTRVVEMGFVMSFIQGRMAEGAYGSVRVNCGILAAYRGRVVRENIDRFLGQTFLGRPVRAGDDRLLTLFAKEQGRAEYQPEAVAYSALPVNVRHLVRQRLRWARSFCWGTLWLLRRPLSTADFWFTFTQVLALVMYGIVTSMSVAAVFSGAVSLSLLSSTVMVAGAVGLISHFRYVLLARPGEPAHERLLTWWVSPLASLLSWSVLLPLYFVATVTPRPQRTWGTRSQVEVSLFAEALAGQNRSASGREAAPATVALAGGQGGSG